MKEEIDFLRGIEASADDDKKRIMQEAENEIARLRNDHSLSEANMQREIKGYKNAYNEEIQRFSQTYDSAKQEAVNEINTIRDQYEAQLQNMRAYIESKKVANFQRTEQVNIEPGYSVDELKHHLNEANQNNQMLSSQA